MASLLRDSNSDSREPTCANGASRMQNGKEGRGLVTCPETDADAGGGGGCLLLGEEADAYEEAG